MPQILIDTTLNAGDTAKVAFDAVNSNDTELYATSPTTNQKGAMTNANSPSSGNSFITQADLVGGLPTGQIPNNFINYDSDVSGFQTTTSSTFVDITSMDLTITISSAIPIVGYFAYTASKTGGGSDSTAAFRIARIDGANSPEYSIGMQVTVNTGSSTENGHVTFRTEVSLSAGTYTFRPQFRRVSGNDTIEFVRGQFFLEAMQAPKGDDGTETLTTIGTLINSSTSVSTPVDADEVAIKNSVGGLLAKVTWLNVKATLKTYFDTLYANVVHTHDAADIVSGVLNADRLAAGTALQVVRRNSGNTALEFATLAGGGDVSKVGTPVSTQVGVWTGDGTIEGTSSLTWDSATSTLRVDGSDPEIQLVGVTNEPTPAPSGELKIYAKSVAGRMMLKMVGSAGIDTVMQPALFGNNTCIWTPSTATAGFWQGTSGAGAGTFSTGLPTVTNFYTAMKRTRYANVVTTLNQVLGQRNTENMFFRGSVAGQGGFFFFCRFGTEVWTAGSKLFIGMATSSSVITGNPSALNNTVGFCIDALDTEISFLTRGTTFTKTAITGQPTLANNQGYDAYIFCKPNDSTIYFRLDDLNTGLTIVNSSTTLTLPTNTTLMSANALASNGANTVVTTTQLGINRIYIETDR
jgi:hypothetical protein